MKYFEILTKKIGQFYSHVYVNTKEDLSARKPT